MDMKTPMDRIRSYLCLQIYNLIYDLMQEDCWQIDDYK